MSVIVILNGFIFTIFFVFYYRLKKRESFFEKECLRLKIVLEEKTRAFESEKVFWQMNERQLKESFQSLSFDALRKNNESFLALAKQTFGELYEKSEGSFSKKEESIKHLVTPMKESLAKLDEKLQHIQKERKAESSVLSEQIRTLVDSEKKLREETFNLVQVLKAPNIRGRWGEIQLRRIVELAGMVEYCDFIEQKTFSKEENIQRPDLIVQMPGECCIAIDAKAPFEAFMEAASESDEIKRREKFETHAKHLRHHINALSKKNYYQHFKRSPEFVVLFLPNESFYTAALSIDPSLLELGAEKGVILATPSTLIGLLKAIAFGWKQDQMSKNAEEVSQLGHELYKRLNDMNHHMMQMGKNLKMATQSYNKTVGSFESRVLVSARKFKELGAATHEITLDSPESLEIYPKELKAVVDFKED